MVIVREFKRSNSNKSFVSLITNPAVLPEGKLFKMFSTEIEAVLATPAVTFIIAKSDSLSLITFVALSTSQATQATPFTPVFVLLIITGCEGLFNNVAVSQFKSPSLKASNIKP